MKKALKPVVLFGAFAICICLGGIIAHLADAVLAYWFPWTVP